MHTFLNAVAALTLTAASTQAGVIYTFVGTGLPSQAVSASLTVSNFINPPLDGGFTSFSCSQLNYPGDGCSIGISFSNKSADGAFSAVLDFYAMNFTGVGGGFPIDYSFDFPTGAFATPGVYSSSVTGNFNPGTLTVTQQAPEPATILLVMSGLCVCGFYRFRAGGPH
jgi:hypothetical protein